MAQGHLNSSGFEKVVWPHKAPQRKWLCVEEGVLPIYMLRQSEYKYWGPVQWAEKGAWIDSKDQGAKTIEEKLLETFHNTRDQDTVPAQACVEEKTESLCLLCVKKGRKVGEIADSDMILTKLTLREGKTPLCLET